MKQFDIIVHLLQIPPSLCKKERKQARSVADNQQQERTWLGHKRHAEGSLRLF